MKNLVITKRINATNSKEVKEQVVDQLKSWGYNVVADEEQAQSFFLAEFGKEMNTEVAQEFAIDGEINYGYQTTINVTIKAHYCDSGSVDYLYTVEVTED
ncbi:hypothetical protein [Hoylesella shahii]|uniref:hypothetical protein n=1 Tax=Hoylesella shahii TaxID=228603 RepID=UPI002061F7FA|nr:hypothetical protein [Hoylesella shahii]DAV47263.1 MAG TPA: hypothetical protein [Caudoviricetes sp.]